MKTARWFPALLTLAAAGIALPATAKTNVAPPHDDRERLARYVDHVAAAFDSSRGGFVAKDGRPSESAVALGFRLARDTRAAWGATWTIRALSTIDWTERLQDTLSGGFADRAPSSDAEGEALGMRADVNGRRLENLVTAWQATDDPRWRRDAARVVDYCDRVLLDGRGGFVTAQIGDRTLEPAANGIALHAWLAWASATGDARPRDFALRSIDRIWTASFDPAGVLVRHGDFGDVTVMPQLADQVEMGRAMLYASQICGRAQDLVRARTLATTIVERFTDPETGAFMTQASAKKDGTMKRAARDAQENARAALFLAELGAATGETNWLEAARRAIAAFDKGLDKSGLDAGDWALALQALLSPESPTRPVWQTAVVERASQPPVMRFKLPRPPGSAR
jgi:uncharacterized protein YyaL (SSP411 family)